MLAIDHVMVLVHDLDEAARRFDQDHGLTALPGGRHVGLGTANAIVPLGDEYIELLAVVDEEEAASNGMGQWALHRLGARGEGVVAVCLRADDLDAVEHRTKRERLAMQRTRPDGVELRWELVALDAALTDGLPFFIRWDVDEGDLPGSAPVSHRSGATAITWVEMGGDAARLDAWLGPHDLPLRIAPGDPGPQRFAVATATGEAILG